MSLGQMVLIFKRHMYMLLMTLNYLHMFLDFYHFSECSFHVQIMACQLFSANRLPETILTYRRFQ